MIEVPKNDLAILTGRETEVIAHESDRPDGPDMILAHAFEDILAQIQVPEPDGPVRPGTFGSRQCTVALRRDRNIQDVGGVQKRGVNLLSGFDLPEAGGVVQAGGDGAPAVTRVTAMARTASV